MYQLVAIGNALVDTEFKLTDEILTQTGLTKGNMTLADTDEQTALFDILNTHGLTPAKQAGGGSAGNTVACFSALGGTSFYSCRVGHDKRGAFYLSDMANMGVAIDGSKAEVVGATGTCAVLVTDDGERTMQTNLAVSGDIDESNVDFDALTGAKYLYLEGYLAMTPSVQSAISKLCQTAKAQGVKIVVSFADPAVVRFAKDGVMAWLADGVDMIFCNMDEAKLFAETDDDIRAVHALLAHAKAVVITNGANPTTVADKDGINIYDVPSADVVDTNGAGDNFAGAFLYALAQGADYGACVALAGAVASRVVSQFGARLPKAEYGLIKGAVLG
ncbi:adenosine kinase [Moraxella lacunata]|uniref:Adenosine kinase n=1 Tax=Moraxella lacunata TaxID=477 RepID=A0A1B8Q5P2_MORLA|nr:adenosine kinase [Moraxella lacunata]MDI4481807.1 adenosine kinase [Moraxella lacunata]MDI4506320.1 adenosine kinase [Moraxella lacunata]OBX63783.1 adenosine kinase [Moraxella lacunata]OBX65038.1 adenosine kinase [Moraxella lacunata]